MASERKIEAASVPSAALVYSVDQGFLPLACASIQSIAKNRTEPLPPATILLHDVDSSSKRSAEAFLSSLDISFDLVDVDGRWCEPWASQRKQSQAKFGILRFEEFLRWPVQRVLIIDADTRFVDDIAPLLELPLGGNPLAATDDIAMIAENRVAALETKLGLRRDTGYFNSGLMVVDSNQWTSEKIGSKAIKVLKERTEILTFNDQCALNAVLHGRYTKLGFRWNHLVGSTPQHWPASMFHYAGHLKPWRLRAVRQIQALKTLLPEEHFNYYARMRKELEWHTPPFGPDGPVQAAKALGRFIWLGKTGRIRSFHDRQDSPHLVRTSVEHPALLE